MKIIWYDKNFYEAAKNHVEVFPFLQRIVNTVGGIGPVTEIFT